jgi:hypothetical protein
MNGFVEQLRLAEKAAEDIYFSKVDQELIEALHKWMRAEKEPYRPSIEARAELRRDFGSSSSCSHKRIQSMWLPDKFYELLPYMYATGGVITTTYADSSIGYASGCLLFLIAAVIFLMRRDYRERRASKKLE